jgi:acetyl esterase
MPSVFYPSYVGGDLHPESEAILSQIAAGNFKPLHAMSPDEARKAFLLTEWLGSPREDVAIHRTQAGDVPVRIYTPDPTGLAPVLIYFHGGGFVRL